MREYWKHDFFKEIQPHVVLKFRKYHMQNPHVYEMFKKFANEAKASGRQRFGMQMIAERMRWYINIETKGEIFKIGNSHISCYTRLLMIEDSSFEKLFVKRSTVSQRELF